MPLDVSCIQKYMRVPDESSAYLAFYVWDECPFIFKMELLIIKGWIFEKKMTFGSIKFCYDIEEVHSKCERLKIIVLHLKSCFIWYFLPNPLAILQICEIFRKSVTLHVTWTYKMPLSLKNVKGSEICPCAKFRFNYIFVARNIANKHFPWKKPAWPRP